MSITTIEEIADLTGVDLSTAMQPAEDLATLSKLLRVRKQEDLDHARSLAVKAVSGTPDEFPQAWDAAQSAVLSATANDAIHEAAYLALSRRHERAEKNMIETALTLLDKHVTKLGREFNKLRLDVLTDPGTAIKHGAPDDYTRAHTIADTLEQIAGLPDIDRHTPRLFVIVNPPHDLPEARIDGNLKLADDHTEHELALITQAVQVSRENTFYMQLLTAARHNWNITIATTPAEVKARYARFRQAAFISDGGYRRTVPA
ncbi:hypothetical protein [Microbacterium soli]|uniref:DUF222 domain-containing protein n=1 Tax=Microbacterium soli TaxID=446075 RepID=A0ABP7NC84_9MICO